MDMTKAFPKEFLSSADLNDPIQVQIATDIGDPVRMKEMQDGKPESAKPVLYFMPYQLFGANGPEVTRKGLSLNVTNSDHLVTLLGSPDSATWPGQWIEIYVDPTVRNPAGLLVGGLRIRAVTAQTQMATGVQQAVAAQASPLPQAPAAAPSTAPYVDPNAPQGGPAWPGPPADEPAQASSEPPFNDDIPL